MIKATNIRLVCCQRSRREPPSIPYHGARRPPFALQYPRQASRGKSSAPQPESLLRLDRRARYLQVARGSADCPERNRSWVPVGALQTVARWLLLTVDDDPIETPDSAPPHGWDQQPRSLSRRRSGTIVFMAATIGRLSPCRRQRMPPSGDAVFDVLDLNGFGGVIENGLYRPDPDGCLRGRINHLLRQSGPRPVTRV